MSEKLKQCREDLAAALDRALEDNIVSPVFSSDSEWLESGRLLQPNTGAFINHPIARMYPSFNSPHLTQPVLQVFSERGPYYCVPAELALMDCNNISFKVKRLVFGNAESFVVNANVPVPDGPFENGCENTDNFTQEYISPSQETNNYTCLEAQENSSPSNSCEELTKNLLEVIDDAAIPKPTSTPIDMRVSPLVESALGCCDAASSDVSSSSEKAPVFEHLKPWQESWNL
ncbi:uncharacterized protein LOC119973840 isoform X2 [Scyliorhinus canicula]|uniref:uncharacterized protein LOC119973840 isoform X2 n=1 Tax=Scyliorhinus canicula TaxID=7830 RepID=UPI0018F58F40|nr:uncharacterized protein LOC119973840 isoform X2 [Scyliorhinus canicula]